MSDSEKQLTFDFGGFFTDSGKSPVSEPDQLDPAISEEEEMDEFLREVRSEKQDAAEESESVFQPEVPEIKTESETSVTEPAPVYSVHEETESVSSDPAAETPMTEPVQISAQEPEAEETTAEPETSAVPQKERPLNRMQLKRAALAFLASLQPSGLAQNVPTSGGRWRTDTAAFWLEQNKKRRRVCRTVLAEVRTEPEAESECADHAEQLDLLKLAKLQREDLEAEIRRTEPELKDDSTLFSEFEHWNYAASRNTAYQECLRKIAQLEHAIYHGTRQERFCSMQAASELYLVVPEFSLHIHDVSEYWGLVYVMKDLTFRVVKEAPKRSIPEENLTRLALSIGASAKPEVLFANGIYTDRENPEAGPLPRKRRRKN